MGIGFLLKFLLRQVSIQEIEAKVAEAVRMPVRVVLNEHAEIAMDADKPEQVALLRADILAREGA